MPGQADIAPTPCQGLTPPAAGTQNHSLLFATTRWLPAVAADSGELLCAGCPAATRAIVCQGRACTAQRIPSSTLAAEAGTPADGQRRPRPLRGCDRTPVQREK